MSIKSRLLAGVLASACASFAAVFTDGMSDGNALVHRWSFTDFSDSVGSATAVASTNTVVCADGAVTLPGAGYLDLGASVIPTSGPFTLEFYATTTKAVSYARIFSVGQRSEMSNTDAQLSEILFLSWTMSGNVAQDEFRLVSGTQTAAQFDLKNQLQPYTLNTPWHIVVSATPQDDGTMKFLVVKEALDGTARRTIETTTGAAWSLSTLNPDSFYLGHSRWAQDADAYASYDEVRIWNTALTLDQIKFNSLLGPDVLPTETESAAIQRVVTANAGSFGQVQLGDAVGESVTSTVACNELVTLVAVPDAGCRFLKWTGSLGSIITGDETATTIVVSAAAAPTLTATFEPLTLTWAGLDAAASNWSNPANWVDPADPFPVFDSGSVIFTGDQRTVNTNDYVSVLKSMLFDADAASFTLRGNALTVPSIANESAAPQQIDLVVTTAASSTLIVTNNGPLAFTQNVTANNAGFTLWGKGTTTFTSNATVTANWIDLRGNGSTTIFDHATLTIRDNLYNAPYMATGEQATLQMTDATVSANAFSTDYSKGTGGGTAYAGGNGTVTQTRGSMTVGNYCIIGRDHVGTYDLVDGTLSSTWGKAEDRFFIGEVQGSDGTLNVSGTGNVNCSPNLQIGRYGTGTLNVNGGSVSSAGWLSLARMGVGVGTVNVTQGGKLNQTSSAYGLIVGEQGQAALNIAGTGSTVTSVGGVHLTGSANATGKISITDGGTLVTPWIRRFAVGTLTDLYVDGGTIRANGSNATLANFLDIANLSVGPQGLTLDTGDNTVITDHTLAPGGSGGTITKVGSGTLVTPITDAGAVKVAEGKLCVAADNALGADGATPRLRHRWSFNGDLNDSVGGQTATANGSTSFVNNTLRLPGGTHGTGYVDLGAGVIPTDGPFTVEIFATQVAIQNWSRIFSFGNGHDGAAAQQNYFFLSWTRGTTIGNDRIALAANNPADATFTQDDSMQQYTLGTKWHIAATFVPNFCGDGRMKVFVTKESLDGTVRKYIERITSGTYSFETMNQDTFFLGHSRWTGDYDAQADYDEVRIWDTALTPEQLAQNAALGPDVLPAAATGTRLDGDALLHRWSFNNGDLKDSIGGTEATAVASVTKSTFEVTLPGGANGTGYLNLGSNMLPNDGSDVTIEIWAKQNAVKHWARVFDIGPNSQNYLTLAWNFESNTARDRCEVKKNNVALFTTDYTLFGYASGTRYHLSMTIQKQADGKSLLTWTRRNAGTGEVIKRGTSTTSAAWTAADIASGPFYLGHSQYSGDNDAAASYDEVRVWKGVMSDAQLTESARRGPDHLPLATATAGSVVELAAGTTLFGSGHSQVETVTGTGTLEGSLEVTKALDIAGEATGTMTLTGALAVTGNWIVDVDGAACDTLAGAASGTLDLTGATIQVRPLGTLRGPYVIATVKSATGCNQAKVALKGYKVKYDADKGQVLLTSDGLCLIVR